MNDTTTSKQPPRQRELELQLFEKIDNKLEALSTRLDEVRDMVIRMDAQDNNAKLKDHEDRLRNIEGWKSNLNGRMAIVIVPASAVASALAAWIVTIFAK